MSHDHSGTREPGVDLRRYVRVVWKWRWFSAAVLVLTVGSAVLFTSLQVPIFQAAATVLIEPEPPKVVNIQDVVGVTPTEEYYATQYKLIESQPVVDGAIQRLRLKERFPDADPQAMIRAGLSVAPVKHTRLVLVIFESPDPGLAAELANGIASEYVRHNLELKHRAAQDALVWLNDQLASLRAQTRQSSRALQNYQARADLLGLKDQAEIARQKILDVNRAYIEAQNQRLSLESKLGELSRISRDPRAAETIFVDDPLIRKLKAEAADLQIERSKLAQIFNEKHPDLQQINAQMKQVNLRLHAEIQKMLRALETQLQVARAREETLLANVNDLRKEARRLNEKEAQALGLQWEKDTNEELQAVVLKRMKEAGVATALEANNVRVVEPATRPALPSKPRKALIWSLSVVAGLALGVGIAFVAESADNKVRTAADIERVVGLPVVAIVPVFQVKGHR